MAMPRSGSWLICVDGAMFRWRVGKLQDRYRDGAGAGDRVIVEAAESARSVLVIVLPYDFGDDHDYSVTPGKVAPWIRRAIQDGWNPQQNGPPHVLKL